MIPTHLQETMEAIKSIDSPCHSITDHQARIIRDVLERITAKWTLDILSFLVAAGGTMRFSELQRKIEGVTQKMLTQTLRSLENDGLLTREIFPEVPPRVEYTLTQLGAELLQQMLPVWNWVANRVELFDKP